MAFKMFQEFPNITADGWNRILFVSKCFKTDTFFVNTVEHGGMYSVRGKAVSSAVISLDGNGLGRLAVCRSTACI